MEIGGSYRHIEWAAGKMIYGVSCMIENCQVPTQFSNIYIHSKTVKLMKLQYIKITLSDQRLHFKMFPVPRDNERLRTESLVKLAQQNNH